MPTTKPQIVFTTAQLGAAIDAIAPAVAAKTVWHEHFLLRLNDTDLELPPTVTVVANNGFQGIERDVQISPMTIQNDFSSMEVCLPYEPFKRALSGMAGEVRVTLTEQSCRLEAPGPNGPAGYADIRAIPNGPSYPPIEATGLGIGIEKMTTLTKSLGMAKQATSGNVNDTPATRNGIRLYVNDNGYIMAEAADGRHANRITVGEVLADDQWNHDFAVTIPANHLSALKELDGEVLLTTDGNKITALNGSTRWTSVLIDGVWPDLDRLIESEPEMYFSINKRALEDHTRNAAIFGKTLTVAKEVFSRVHYHLSIEDETLTVSAENREYGSYERIIPVKEGPWEQSHSNVHWFMDASQVLAALAGIDADEVEVSLHSNGRMLHIQGERQHHMLSVVVQ